MGITTAEPAARLLALSRLTSRAGRPLTGVDRVEYAYLDRLLQETAPLFGLVRSSLGYILLDARGCKELRARLDRGDWDAPDLLSKLNRRLDPLRARAETTLRKTALDRCLPARLARMLSRHLPARTQYINTGHSNLSSRVLKIISALPHARIAVLLHDTIPLDYPEFQARGATERFAALFARITRHADLIICNSEQTRQDLLRHLPPTGSQPASIVARLGVELPKPGPPPSGPWSGNTTFVTLGTIEPRKNHALLLDIWETDPPDADLLICGHRGWNNAETFARLDRGIPRVHELPGLNDAAVFGLLQQSAGLLFPSHAEGYGLPPIEATAFGVPTLCADLPVFRETLGDIPVYASLSDGYLWATKIRQMAQDHRAGPVLKRNTPDGFTAPDWNDHFKIVLTLI